MTRKGSGQPLRLLSQDHARRLWSDGVSVRVSCQDTSYQTGHVTAGAGASDRFRANLLHHCRCRVGGLCQGQMP
jgi:hypothetical protein